VTTAVEAGEKKDVALCFYIPKIIIDFFKRPQHQHVLSLVSVLQVYVTYQIYTQKFTFNSVGLKIRG
jgi:hypothetical protein